MKNETTNKIKIVSVLKEISKPYRTILLADFDVPDRALSHRYGIQYHVNNMNSNLSV